MSDTQQTIAERLAPILAGTTKPADVPNVVKDIHPEALREYLNSTQLTGEQLSRLTPGGYGAHGLTFGENMRAIGAQTKGLFEGGVTKAPGRIGRALWDASAFGGGAARMGTGHRARYIPMAARLGTATFLLPEAMNTLHAEDATGEGRSRTERIGGVIGGLGANLAVGLPPSVLNRLGMGGMAAHMALGHYAQTYGQQLGQYIGRKLDAGISSARGVAAGDATHESFRKAQQQNTRAV
jgi:hypothetical protein